MGPVDTTATPALHIHALVTAKPGLTRSDLRRATGLAWGTITQHVDQLLEAGQLHALDDPKHQYLFATQMNRAAMRRHVIMARPHARAVLDLFSEHRELDTIAVMEHTGLTRRIARNRLQDLEDAGIIERRGEGRPRFARSTILPTMLRAQQPPAHPHGYHVGFNLGNQAPNVSTP